MNDRPIRVLLVDDHKTVLWGLSKLIEGEAPRMEIAGKASTREEALDSACTLHPDVILLDVDLNGSNSLEIVPDLLRDSDARVLILTGLRSSEVREFAMLQGASGIVMKEESAETLLQAIECVHEGELWLDRATAGEIVRKLSGPKAQPDRESEKISSLTPRERTVIAALVKERGVQNHKLATALQMSGHTLRNHLSSIYSKLGVFNRLELYLYAVEHGLGEAAA